MGRQQYNILDERAKALRKEGRWNNNLQLARIVALTKRKAWLRKFRFKEKGFGYVPDYHRHIAWSAYRRKREGDFDQPFVDAEIAMLLCGRKSPLPRFDKDSMPLFQPNWYDQFFWLYKVCIDMLDPDSKFLLVWTKKGQKPDPQKIYRTAVCTLVARKMEKPKGCHPDYLPSPKAIAQAWFLIYGEHEKADSIRKRMKTVGKFCSALKHTPLCNENQKVEAYLLHRPIKKKYS